MIRWLGSILCCGLVLGAGCVSRDPLEVRSPPTIGEAVPPASGRAPAASGNSSNSSTSGSQQEAIEQYRAVLATETDSATRSEVARRTAELEMAGGGSGAIKLFEDLLVQHPGAPDNDRVLYQLARAYDGAGRPQDSLAALSRLLREYPASVFAAEARFRRAERWFASGRFLEAEQDYLVLADASARHGYADLAQHKLGWCALKSQRPAVALPRFLQVLDRQITEGTLDANGNLPAAALEPARQELIDDALRGTSLALALSEGPAAAGRSRSPPRAYEPLLYRRLGEFFMERGDAGAAAQTYRAFLAARPAHPAAARFQLLAAQALTVTGDKSAALQAQEALLQYYREPPPTASSNILSEAEQTQLFAQVLRKKHARAQETKAAADYAAAAENYRLALQRFPARSDWRYLHAELLFESSDYPRAATEYEQLAYETAGFDQAEAAGYASVLARQKAIRNGDPATLAGFTTGVERFLEKFPRHGERAALQLEAARQTFLQQKFDAVPALAARVRGNPGASPDIQRSALALSAQSQLALNQLMEAQSSADAWLKLASPSDGQFVAMRELRARAAYRQAEQLRATDPGGDAAVAAFLRLSELAPNDLSDPAGRIRASAEFDAAALLIEQKRWLQVTNVLVGLRQAFPQHPQRVEVSRRLALAYRELGQVQQAAAELSVFAKEAGDPQLARIAAFDAAELRRKAGDTTGAINGYTEYLKRHPQPLLQALEARAALAALEGIRAQRQAQTRWLKEIVAQSTGQSDLRVRTLGAQAALALASQSRDEFVATPLKSPLTDSLPRKRQRLEAALAAYAKVSGYGIAETSLAAGFHGGELPALLAQALVQAPPPRELDAQQRVAFAELLNTQATQLRDQAIVAHRRNLAQASATGLLEDPYSKRSIEALIALGAPPSALVSSDGPEAPTQVVDPPRPAKEPSRAP